MRIAKLLRAVVASGLECGLLALLAFVAPGVRADVSASIQSLAVTNYTGYIIASDADQVAGKYNRDAIVVRAVMNYGRLVSSRETNFVFEYYLHFRLLDTNGTAQPLRVGAGTNTDLVVSYKVDRSNPNVIPLPVTSVAALTPAGLLNPYSPYRVELKIYRGTAGILIGRPTDTGLSTTDFPYRYFQFTNTNAGDENVNVIPDLLGASVIRTFMIDPSPSQNSFQVNLSTRLYRYDAWKYFIQANNVAVRYELELLDAADGTSVPLAQSVYDLVKSVPSYMAPVNATAVPMPAILDVVDTIGFAPAPGHRIDALNHTYHLNVKLSHFEAAGDLFSIPANAKDTTVRRYVQLSGALLFGDIPTTFKHVSSGVVPGAIDAAGMHVTIAVDAQSGYVNALPDHTYGNGTPLNVVVHSNGDAVVESGATSVTLPPLDVDALNDIRFQRYSVQISQSGGTGFLGAHYPTGFGHSQDPANRILNEIVPFVNAKLTADLRPAVDLTYAPSDKLFGCEESKPVWFAFAAVTWLVHKATFTFDVTGEASCVRSDEYKQLNLHNVSKEAAQRRDNSRYYEFVIGIRKPVSVRAGADGEALMTAILEFDAGRMWPHFPRTSGIQWKNGGKQVIEDDLVVPADSGLEGVQNIGVDYARDCTADDCNGVSAGPETLTLIPDTGHLSFTIDGGLDGTGVLLAPTPLHWGWIPTMASYAQRTEPFVAANFLMPGIFMRGDQSANAPELKAATLLFTGMRPDDLSKPERYNATPYAEGFGDYPGLNFRVGSTGLHAESVIAAKPSGLYPLTPRSKYYVRQAGVSGIHEAVFGEFPKEMKLYGYAFTFSNYGLSYLGNQNHESRTDGTVYVPAPSDFTQNFENMKFTCLGAPGPAEVPANEAKKLKLLSYWVADFLTIAIAFDRKDDQNCDPGAGVLTLGVEAYAQHIADNIHGTLGFWPNGNLITLEDCQKPAGPLDPPFDSRLKLPNSFKLRGPKKEQYVATPVNDAYFNNYAAAPGDQGFINVAAKLDVPFFEDLEVHIHTSASIADTNAPVYLMGGWPDKGFGDAAHNFFTENPYDVGNRGFPKGAKSSVESYRSGADASDDHYRVRAQRTWLNVVHFDYPLKWSSSTRAFTSFMPIKNNVVIMSVEHQVKYLSAKNAELKFGVQYDIMPQANLANLAFDELGGLEKAFEGVISAQIVSKGMNALDDLLDANLKKLMSGAMDAALDAALDPLYDEIEGNYNHVTKTLNAGFSYSQFVTKYVSGPGSATVLAKIKAIGQQTGNAVGLAKEIADRIDQASQALDEIDTLLAKDGAGQRGKAVQLVQQVASVASSLLDSPEMSDKIGQFLQDADPTLEDVLGVLHDLKKQLDGASQKLRSGLGMAQEIQSKIAAATTEVNKVVNQVQSDFNSVFASFKPGLDDPFKKMTRNDFKILLKEKIENRLFASKIADIIHHAIKQQVYDLNASIREGLDSVFAQFNIVIRDLLSEAMNGISDKFTNFAGEEGGSGGIPSGVAAAGRIDGYAHIVGDSLNELRLDIRAKLKVPSEMKFDGFLRIRELNSENTPQSCIPGGGKAMEVSIGANDVKVGWISPDLRANVNAKFTFATSPKFYPAGFGAGFELIGPLKYETFTIRELGAAMAFGEKENYFSGEAAVEFNGYKGKGGIYFGRTCSLDPFFWDKDVQSLIGTPPFTGIYVYGEVWIPVSEALLGIPATCFFQVSAGVGAGAGYFAEGPTYIGKMFLGASGDLLCIISVEGDIYLIGVKNKDGFALKGVGELSASLGPCPFCISFSKSIGITYKNSKWDVDF
jgi:hypothetical protein